MKFKEPQQALFLQQYALNRCVRKSARIAGISDMAVFDLRKRSPEFAEKMQQAEDAYVERIVHAAHKRAVEGVDEPIFGQGGQVGTRKKFSDALLIRLLQRYDPSFRETSTTKVEGRVEHALTIDLEALKRLPAEKREQLREILSLMEAAPSATADGAASPPAAAIEADYSIITNPRG